MSVQLNHYVIIGHKFEYDEFYDTLMEKFNLNDGDEVFNEIEEPYHDSAFKGIQHHNDLCIISDGMNGNYVYVGYVLQKSDDNGSLTDYINPKIRSAKYVSNKINEMLRLENIKCEKLAFSHYR